MISTLWLQAIYVIVTGLCGYAIGRADGALAEQQRTVAKLCTLLSKRGSE